MPQEIPHIHEFVFTNAMSESLICIQISKRIPAQINSVCEFEYEGKHDDISSANLIYKNI